MVATLVGMPGHDMLFIADEVRTALAEQRPVVALESSIVTHGMPYPENLATAEALTNLVRQNGAVPAIVAVVDGRLCVGVDDARLERLATAEEVEKVSRRDLAAVLASGKLGGTTVAATMLAAHWAGIRIFATGGIGGVHRGVAETFDISADLTELSRTPVAVVCAGAKSILDIPKTVEMLETSGVPVLGYRTAEFPAFFSRGSGTPLDRPCSSVDEIAAIVAIHWRLGLTSGVVVANPIPPQDAIAEDELEGWISGGLRDAAAAAVAGKDLTPFLLDRVNELSGGRTLAANIALVKNNAALAARLAVALAARS